MGVQILEYLIRAGAWMEGADGVGGGEGEGEVWVAGGGVACELL